jgi:endo-1,4-beta-xylanase
VPVQALGIQAHLLADHFGERFNAVKYRAFLREVADRGLKILITEMDVTDDGLPADRTIRDRGVADVYARYLDVTLQEPSVRVLMTFGLSDRYTWLQEDYPRDDGAGRRPLPFNRKMERVPAFWALQHALQSAPRRTPLWIPPRAR